MQYKEKIPIDKKEIRLIIRAFEDGEFMYRSIEEEHPTKTHNGRGANLWNWIFTELDNSFKREGYQVDTVHRGFWDALYIYDENTEYLYTFMRYKNFINLQDKNPKNKLFHYANVLTQINNILVGKYEIENEQLSFGLDIPYNLDIDKELQELLGTMISKIKGEIKRYAMVLVDQKAGKVEDIECVIPVRNFDTVYHESWKDCIDVQYGENGEYLIEETKPIETNINLQYKNEPINLDFQKKKKKKKKTVDEEHEPK